MHVAAVESSRLRWGIADFMNFNLSVRDGVRNSMDTRAFIRLYGLIFSTIHHLIRQATLVSSHFNLGIKPIISSTLP